MASINAFRAHPKQVSAPASKHAALGVMRGSGAQARGARRARQRAGAGAGGDRGAARAPRDPRGRGRPAPEPALAAYAAQTALGRIVTEGEVAEAAAFLLSDAASGLTGVVLPVEAGMG